MYSCALLLREMHATVQAIQYMCPSMVSGVVNRNRYTWLDCGYRYTRSHTMPWWPVHQARCDASYRGTDMQCRQQKQPLHHSARYSLPPRSLLHRPIHEYPVSPSLSVLCSRSGGSHNQSRPSIMPINPQALRQKGSCMPNAVTADPSPSTPPLHYGQRSVACRSWPW